MILEIVPEPDDLPDWEGREARVILSIIDEAREDFPTVLEPWLAENVGVETTDYSVVICFRLRTSTDRWHPGRRLIYFTKLVDATMFMLRWNDK